MIKTIVLNNFKTFVNQRLDFSGLTVLTGVNASGKSSIIQAIRAIKRSVLERGQLQTVASELNMDKLCSRLVINKTIKLNMDVSGGECGIEFSKEKGLAYVGDEDKMLSMKHLMYLSASRIGQKDAYRISQTDPCGVGENGEWVFSFLEFSRRRYFEVPEAMRLNESHLTLAENIDDWLGCIAPDSGLTYENNDQSYFPKYGGTIPSETGFGLSYALPVLVALLHIDNARSDDVLLLENPEAHLHPRAQTELGRLMALSVSCGKQVIVETHSDHIIDGIRLAVKNADIDKDKVDLLFLQREGMMSPSMVEMLHIMDDGSLDNWPDGFFDQGLKDKAALML